MESTANDQEKGSAYLVYEFERRAYPLSGRTFTIGRNADSDIVIREPAVSRSHVEVRPEDGEFTVHSTGATGTLLNGDPLTAPAKLEDGDRLAVGSMEFTFRRGRLPLGVSVVDTTNADGHDADAMTKRPTITNPILGSTPAVPPKTSSPAGMIVLLVVLIGAVAWYFFGR